jgi:hypothetical protein
MSAEKADLSVEDIELENLFFPIGKGRGGLRLKELRNEVE